MLPRRRAGARRMIGSLRGPVTHVGLEHVLVEVAGIGYRVSVGPDLLGRLRQGSEARLFTHHLVRDDQQALFGFASTEELAFFELLMTVGGVGPRLALGITSSQPVTKLQVAIVSDDVDVFTAVSGVGRKTAQRIILELKEKVHAAGIAASGGATLDSDVVAALEALGYTAVEARRAAGAVAGGDGGLDARIRAALQELARTR
ncbi:MAG TPA: Holliday junction branch migration protein RuvA [Candidatus Limnocylindria bacterium]|nr:Holliday junction branch migration protein RuvA [Candidatus Limnocylindria bacterium]